MSRNYDNWGTLVEAVMHREQFRQLSLASSISTSYDSDFSSSTSSYRYDDPYFTSSPLRSRALSHQLAETAAREVPVPASKKRNLWRVLSIFQKKSNFYFKKVYVKTAAEKESRWANSQRTFHGHEPIKTYSWKSDSQTAQQESKKKTEFERLQELYTLKGRIEALVKAKGLDNDSFNHYYYTI